MNATPVSVWFSLHLHDHLITKNIGLAEWAQAVGISLGVARKLAAGSCTICAKTHMALQMYGINLMEWNEQPGRSTVYTRDAIEGVARSHGKPMPAVHVRPRLRHATRSLWTRILRFLKFA